LVWNFKIAFSAAQTRYVKALNAPDYASFRRAESPARGTLQWLLRDKMVNTWLSKINPHFSGSEALLVKEKLFF
jgi:hypothetical protein